MAGKRYTKDETDLIVRMMNEGKKREEVQAECLKKFKTTRSLNQVAAHYKNNKATAEVEVTA
jgi:hypothetical protein